MLLEKLGIIGGMARSELITRGTPISIGIALIILGGVYIYATEIQALKGGTAQNAEAIESIQGDYVPRVELEGRLQRLEDNQQEILRHLRG